MKRTAEEYEAEALSYVAKADHATGDYASGYADTGQLYALLAIAATIEQATHRNPGR